MQKWRMLAIGVGVLEAATAMACYSASPSPAVTGKPASASEPNDSSSPVAKTVAPAKTDKGGTKGLEPVMIAPQAGSELVAAFSARAVADSSGNQYVAYYTRDGHGANHLELVVFRKARRRWGAPLIVAADLPRSLHLVATANGAVVVWHAQDANSFGMARARTYSLDSGTFASTVELGQVFDTDWAFTSNGSRAYAGFAGSASQSNNPGHLYDPGTGRWLETRGVNGRGVALTSSGELSWFDWTIDKAKPFGIFSSNRERVPFGYFAERADDGNGFPGADLGLALPGHGTFMRLRGRQFSFDESKRAWTELAFSRECEGQTGLEGGTVLGSRFEGTRWVMCTMTGEGAARDLVSFPNVRNVLVAASGNEVALTTEDARGAVKLVRFDARSPEHRAEDAIDVPSAKPHAVAIGGGVSVAYLAGTVAGRTGLYAATHVAD